MIGEATPITVSVSQGGRYVPATAADNRAIREAGQSGPGGESETGEWIVRLCKDTCIVGRTMEPKEHSVCGFRFGKYYFASTEQTDEVGHDGKSGRYPEHCWVERFHPGHPEPQTLLWSTWLLCLKGHFY